MFVMSLQSINRFADSHSRENGQTNRPYFSQPCRNNLQKAEGKNRPAE